jgi:hypothetical protein
LHDDSEHFGKPQWSHLGLVSVKAATQFSHKEHAAFGLSFPASLVKEISWPQAAQLAGKKICPSSTR